ncbi:MAG: hypothetical protein Q7O66_16765 [Dehalococcoidia bacterium]|nr:hypothetical protein [Dehalococcoidia bacterium]
MPEKSRLTRLICYVDEATALRIQHAAVDARLSVSTFLGYAALQIVERMEETKEAS